MDEEVGGERPPSHGGASGPAGPGLDDRGARILTHVVYGLQAALIFNGITLLLGAILNYVKRTDVQGTVYASHFRHQIRTFWVSVAGFLAFLALVVALVAPAAWDTGAEPPLVQVFLLGLVGLGVVVYVYYRILKGWLALLEERPLP